MPSWYYWCEQSDSIDLDHARRLDAGWCHLTREIELLTFRWMFEE